MFFVQVHVVLSFNRYLFKFMNMLEFDYTPQMYVFPHNLMFHVHHHSLHYLSVMSYL